MDESSNAALTKQVALQGLILRQLLGQQNQPKPDNGLAALLESLKPKEPTLEEQIADMLKTAQPASTQTPDPNNALAAALKQALGQSEGQGTGQSSDIEKLLKSITGGQGAAATDEKLNLTPAAGTSAEAASILAKLAGEVTDLKSKLSSAEAANNTAQLKAAFRDAANKAGITNEAKLADIEQLYAENFKAAEGGGLVLMNGDKPAMRPDNPLLPITAETFFAELKTKRSDYWDTPAAPTAENKKVDNILEMFGQGLNGNTTSTKSDEVLKIDVTDVNFVPNEEQLKAIEENRVEYYVGGIG